jgi:hypothetical protein
MFTAATPDRFPAVDGRKPPQEDRYASEEGDAMIRLRDKQTGADIGAISEEQLRFLVDHLEEEYEEDRDYYIQRELLDMLEEAGGDPELVAMLARAMGDGEVLEIEWSRE